MAKKSDMELGFCNYDKVADIVRSMPRGHQAHSIIGGCRHCGGELNTDPRGFITCALCDSPAPSNPVPDPLEEASDE